MKGEDALQASLVAYLALLRIKAVAVPNGAHLAGDKIARARAMNRLKGTGLCVGFPDLMLFHRTVANIGFVEVKTEAGRLSDAQKACHEWLLDLGHRVAVVRSIDDMAETLTDWGWLTQEGRIAA